MLVLDFLAIQVTRSVQAMCDNPDLHTGRQQKLVRQVSVRIMIIERESKNDGVPSETNLSRSSRAPINELG